MMFIYNVTVIIDADVSEDWLKWMKEVHVPDVMKSGCFVSSQILKVWGPEEQGPTYSVQYKFLTLTDIEKYNKDFAPALQADHKKKFGEKYTAFRTVLQYLETPEF